VVRRLKGQPVVRNNNFNINNSNRGNRHHTRFWQTLTPDSVQAAIQRLFDASVILEDSAFHDLIGALCKLSLEMVSMQSGTDVGSGAGAGAAGEGTLDAEDDIIPSASTSATSLVTPRTELFSRRRVSGIYIPRTLVRTIVPLIAKRSPSIDRMNE